MCGRDVTLPGKEQFNLNTSFHRFFEGIDHPPARSEVRCGEEYALSGMVDAVIEKSAHPPPSLCGRGKDRNSGQPVVMRLKRRGCRYVGNRDRLSFPEVPRLLECRKKLGYDRAFKEYPRVPPPASHPEMEPPVLIGDVQAPGERLYPVDDYQFSMIPVSIVKG